jgi:hypothetical protein
MRDIFKQMYPSIPNIFWAKLVKLARGSMDPRLFDYNRAHAHRLIALPIDDQKRLLDEGVEVAEEQTDGTIDFRRMKLADMTSEQIDTVVAGTKGLRGLAEQTTRLKNAIKKRNIKVNAAAIAKSSVVVKATKEEPYTVGHRGIQFHGSCRLSWTKLRNLVEKHDKKGASE